MILVGLFLIKIDFNFPRIQLFKSNSPVSMAKTWAPEIRTLWQRQF